MMLIYAYFWQKNIIYNICIAYDAYLYIFLTNKYIVRSSAKFFTKQLNVLSHPSRHMYFHVIWIP